MGKDSRFWDRIADKYARQPIADEASYQRKLDITRTYLTPDAEMFEFGCGTGSTALLHAPRVRHIQAIDISPRMIEIARGKAEAAGVDNITFSVAKIDTFNAPAESFDIALGMSILHLVADRDAVIAAVRRLLKPGGVFLSSTACLGDNMALFRFLAPLGRILRLLPLVKVFKADALADSIVRAGFEIEDRWQPGKNKAVFIAARKTS